jgi:hypothetical protein
MQSTPATMMMYMQRTLDWCVEHATGTLPYQQTVLVYRQCSHYNDPDAHGNAIGGWIKRVYAQHERDRGNHEHF